MKKMLSRLFGLVLMFAVLDAFGAEKTPIRFTPLQLSIWNPVQLAPADWDVSGLRLNLPSKDYCGLQAGLFNVLYSSRRLQNLLRRFCKRSIQKPEFRIRTISRATSYPYSDS